MANSADSILIIFLFFPENRIWYFIGDNLHEMSKIIFWKKKKEKYLKMSSAENFTQTDKNVWSC